MPWLRTQDEHCDLRAIREVGIAGNGAWLALATYSAKELTDGVLRHDDLTWALEGLVRGHVEHITELMGSLGFDAGSLRDALRLSRDQVIETLVTSLVGAGLLRKRPGPRSGWELLYPDGEAFTSRNPSRAETKARRAADRERKRATRRLQRELDVDGEGVRERSTDWNHDESRNVQGVGSGSKDQETASRASAEPAAAGADVAAALAHLEPDRPTQAAVEAAVRAAGVPRSQAVDLVVRKAAEARSGARMGKIRNPLAWLRAVVPRAVGQLAGELSEREHRQRVQHEKRSPEDMARAKRERQLAQDAQVTPNFGGAAGLLAALVT